MPILLLKARTGLYKAALDQEGKLQGSAASLQFKAGSGRDGQGAGQPHGGSRGICAPAGARGTDMWVVPLGVATSALGPWHLGNMVLLHWDLGCRAGWLLHGG